MPVHFAICQYYEPFVMGGNVWQWRRFGVESEQVELVDGFTGFVFYDELTKEWRVHELTTGGLIGEGPNRLDAIHKANTNIKETPDLREQMKSLGDTTQFPVVEAADALARIAKKQREKA